MPLYIAFIDLTKAFHLVSRSGLFELLRKIGWPPHLLAIITSFHEDMHSTVWATSEAFQVSSGVTQGCILAPTLFGIFFFMLLQYASKDFSEGIYIYTRADNVASTSHTEDGLQQLASSTPNSELLTSEMQE